MEGVLSTPSNHIEAPALVAHSQGRGAPRRIGAPSSVDARKQLVSGANTRGVGCGKGGGGGGVSIPLLA